MATWIHFTEDVGEFLEQLSYHEDDSPDSFSDEGLFVYKYHQDFPVEERGLAWGGRTDIIIECDEKHVELVQTDPLGDNPDNDEYIIPVANFKHCTTR